MRFPGFEGQWKNTNLRKIAKFSKGKGISKNDIEENGEIECVRYGELYTHYGEVISEIKSKTNVDKMNLIFSEANDVIIPASGETQIDIATAACVLRSGVALGGDLNIIKTSNNGVFLSYYLNSKRKIEIARLAQGVSVVHLYSSQLASLDISYPTLAEQNKVASFLSLTDERISTQNKIIEYLNSQLKNLSHKIFSQELRFKDENENIFPDWKEKELKNICSFYSGGTPKSTNKSFYLGNIPFVGSGNISDDSVENFITNEALTSSSAKLVEKGDLLYALYGATSGEVAISKISGAINQAVLCIRTNQNKDYLFYLLKNSKDRIVQTFIQGGQGNLSAKIVKELKFNFPNLEEQTKIASFLSLIDVKLKVEKTILKQLTVQKKYLLQQLFI